MKEKPILFSAPMVRAIMDGLKTQTRRIVKPRWLPVIEESNRVNGYPALSVLAGEIVCPHGEVGDRLWVRETFCAFATPENTGEIFYRADGHKGFIWTPSIHMPRWASRINLEIVSVRVERLQEISEEDAIAEGLRDDIGAWSIRFPNGGISRCIDPRQTFSDLWESINGQGSWEKNTWVWVVEFKRI